MFFPLGSPRVPKPTLGVGRDISRLRGAEQIRKLLFQKWGPPATGLAKHACKRCYTRIVTYVSRSLHSKLHLYIYIYIICMCVCRHTIFVHILCDISILHWGKGCHEKGNWLIAWTNGWNIAGSCAGNCSREPAIA